MRRTRALALAGPCGCFLAALCAPAVAERWRQRASGQVADATCDDPVCTWCARVAEVGWVDDEAHTGRGPFVLATALALTAEGTPEAEALSALLGEAGGSERVLRAAYGGGMALAFELPDDRAAHDTVDLLNKALHAAATRTGTARG